MPEPARLSIVLLTEDSGKDGRATLEALTREMLDLVVPGYGSHRIKFVPRDPREEEAMRGNGRPTSAGGSARKSPSSSAGRCEALVRALEDTRRWTPPA
jgi:hypothetical protein